MAGIDRACGICIRGVSEACTTDMLSDAFKGFGSITDTFVKAAGRGRSGYAFVTFADQSSVAAALSGAPASVGGDAITVEARSAPRERRQADPSENVYVKGLNDGTTEDQVRAAVAGFGAIASLEVAGDGRGFAFIGFESADQATAAVNASPLSIGGAQCDVEFRMSKPRGARSRAPRERRTREIAPNSVYLKGIPVDASDEDISSALAGFGAVTSVSHREGRDFAFAVLDSADAMNAAISGSVTVGGLSVVVEERTGGKPGAASQ